MPEEKRRADKAGATRLSGLLTSPNREFGDNPFSVVQRMESGRNNSSEP